ncbi:hypothetical protein LBMAG56_40630 [Verrucomicrobiota bacterium]|nr:hypothetical protein LBMAG56_40630 [Verrucomicrobiota bacterium]
MNDYELTNQLYAFMQSIPVLWTWDRLAELHAPRQPHQESRGPEDNQLTFELDVLENSAEGGRPYLHIGISVSDLSRKKDTGAGSAWSPLCTSFLWYQDGESDMPTGWEIFEDAFRRDGQQ